MDENGVAENAVFELKNVIFLIVDRQDVIILMRLPTTPTWKIFTQRKKNYNYSIVYHFLLTN